uniref:Uncharacterized protein n=1 Tax=Anguilla anguilla TaxID=7936 RepID=A0A0E9RW90_ANGAN
MRATTGGTTLIFLLIVFTAETSVLTSVLVL